MRHLLVIKAAKSNKPPSCAWGINFPTGFLLFFALEEPKPILLDLRVPEGQSGMIIPANRQVISRSFINKVQPWKTFLSKRQGVLIQWIFWGELLVVVVVRGNWSHAMAGSPMK
jgi:hypothetical protein